MQPMFLEMLEKGASVAVDDALGRARGARGIEDGKWVIERHLLEVDAVVGCCHHLLPGHGVPQTPHVACLVHPGNDDDMSDAGHGLQNLRHPGPAVEMAAAIGIAIGGDQHLRVDLAEAVEDAPGSEIRRGGRPHRTQTGRRQLGDNRLGQVGEICRDPIATADPLIGKPGTHRRDGVMEFAEGQGAPAAALSAAHDGHGVVAFPKQVLGIVEAGPGEPAGPGHGIAVVEDRLPGPGRPDAGEFPHERPEGGPLVDGPVPQRLVVRECPSACLFGQAPELPEGCCLPALLARRPENVVHQLASAPDFLAARSMKRAMATSRRVMPPASWLVRVTSTRL